MWNNAQYNGNFPQSKLDCSNESWKLVFYDEFDGNSIDVTKWFTYRPTSNGTDNSAYSRGINDGEFKGLFVDSNVEVDNGKLKLHVKKETTTWFGETFGYSAAIINSKYNHQYKYGKFEARIKMHKGGGFFPAFWLFNGYEIDIIEYKGIMDAKKFPATLHRYWTDNGVSLHKQDPYSIKRVNGNRVDFSQNFHIYAVEWSPHKIDWFVDGNLVRTVYRYRQDKQKIKYIDGNAYIYSIKEYVDCDNYQNITPIDESKVMGDAPLNIILNTSINDNPVKFGTIDDNDFPSFMEIDYVRVYQKVPQTGKYDLCGGTIDGLEEICFGGQETYTFNGDLDNITWTTSTNFNIINTSSNSIIVSPTNNGFSTGWVKATVDFVHAPCSTKTYTKTLYAGNLITGTINQSTPVYSSQTLQTVNFITANTGNTFTTFNVELDNPTNTYDWQITSGNGSIGGTNWNPQLITIPPNSTSLSYEISTTTDCGNISRTVAFVPTSGWYRISPNPASDFIQIQAVDDFEVLHSDENGNLTNTIIRPQIQKVELYELHSETKILETNSNTPQKILSLDIGNISKGNYILRIYDENNFIINYNILIER